MGDQHLPHALGRRAAQDGQEAALGQLRGLVTGAWPVAAWRGRGARPARGRWARPDSEAARGTRGRRDITVHDGHCYWVLSGLRGGTLLRPVGEHNRYLEVATNRPYP